MGKIGSDEQPPNEIVERFGFDPRQVGRRFRGWFVVEEVGSEEALAGAEVGDLGVRARDGAANPPDVRAGARRNYVGTAEDGFDRTYRYYYFHPLEEVERV